MEESLLNSYFEKRGLKYIVPFSGLSYLLGTIIFNTYLYNLGITEFDLLKLRYVLVGLVFSVMTALIFLILYGVAYGFYRYVRQTKIVFDWDKIKLIELVLLVTVLPWSVAYALYVFPLIPSAFGGAKPELVRLIGETDTIKQLNDVIAFETGIDPATLPLEKLSESSDLAVGANVKVLDRNSSRVIMVLTKDLYLSTTSSVAKKLLDSGAVKTFDDDDYASDFTPKPIIFSASSIRGTTSNLYQPSAVTSQADIEVVTRVLTQEPEKAAKVQAAITDDLKEAAPKLVQAVQKKVAENQVNEEAEISSGKNVEELVQELLKETFDTQFIAFRGELFRVINYAYLEQKTGDQSLSSRQRVAKKFAEMFEDNYPNEWQSFSGNKNFLILGQSQSDYFLRLQRVVQGANTAEMIMERLNAETVQIGPDFNEIRTGVLELLGSSSAENSATNRKYIGEVIQRYLRQKAPQMTIYWFDNGYLVEGVPSEKFLGDLNTIFTQSSDWEDLSTQMKGSLSDMNAVVAEVETTETTETTEENKSKEPVSDSEPTENTESVTQEPEAEKNSAPTDEATGEEAATPENSAPTQSESTTTETDTDQTSTDGSAETTEPDAEKKSAPSEEPLTNAETSVEVPAAE